VRVVNVTSVSNSSASNFASFDAIAASQWLIIFIIVVIIVIITFNVIIANFFTTATDNDAGL
jgi:hypothetical protein